MKQLILNFYNIKFYQYSFNKILSKLNKDKGYLVAPAASGLVEIKKNKIYYNSLLNSKIAIFDSGFFCILIFIFKGIWIKKFSGFYFLSKFIKNRTVKKKKILLIDPNYADSIKNRIILNLENFINHKSYVAPFYKNNFDDKKLFNLIKKYNPKYILINIGGLKQEILAYNINQKSPNKYVILCLGAAIGFLSGSQAPISNFTDKFYLGWFIRILFNPKNFLIRVLKSFSLILFFLNKKERDKIKII